MGNAIKFESEFIKKRKESKDAYTFYFKRPKDFNFISGQYVKIFLNIKNPDVRGSSRYFTISSSPYEKNFIAITTRIIKSSFKLELNRLRAGDLVTIFGPVGYFDFYPDKQKNVVFIAGGIGVTPFHSIFKSIKYEKIKSNITLFTSFDHRENVVFYEELKKIENENLAVRVVHTLTKEKKNYSEFEKGRLDADMIKKYVQDFEKPYYFITGSERMVNEMFEIIKRMGISEDKIFKEDFPGY